MAKAASEIPRNQILQGHVIDVLRSMPDECIDCAATSPPYWNLRNYSTEPQIWGGDPGCAHGWETERILETRGVDGSTLDGEFDPEANRFDIEWAVCRLCGSWRGHLGLERIPDCFSWARGEQPCNYCYCCHLRSVFSEIRRVLRPHGTLWVNIADSYTSGNRKYRDPGQSLCHEAQRGIGRQPTPPGLKNKDLVGAPWSLAFALRADGFYLRNDNLWAKDQCMPTSARDRCTVSHEYVFMFSKRESYFYDGFAVRERALTAASGNKRRLVAANGERGRLNTHMGSSIPWANDGSGRNKRTVWRMSGQQFNLELCGLCGRVYERSELNTLAASEGVDQKTRVCRCGRFDGWVSHFAVFPEDLAATAILAGTSEKGCCSDCGAPWRRVVERAKLSRPGPTGRNERSGGLTNKEGFDRAGITRREISDWLNENSPRTVAWEPSCTCRGRFIEEKVPAEGGENGGTVRVYVPEIPLEAHPIRRPLVLDCFMGSGTTALVALKAGRDFLGVELNEDYIRIAEHRIAEEAAQAKLF